MKPSRLPTELILQLQRDRAAIRGELPELESLDERLRAAASEDTLCGHLRQAIHASRRSLKEIAGEAGIDLESLCRFLEGEQALQSDVLDRLAHAAGVAITLTLEK